MKEKIKNKANDLKELFFGHGGLFYGYIVMAIYFAVVAAIGFAIYFVLNLFGVSTSIISLVLVALAFLSILKFI